MYRFTFAVLQTGSSKIYQPTLPKAVIDSIDIMTLSIVVVTNALHFLWMSYRGAHMLTGSLLEDSYPKYSHTVRPGNN